MKKCLIAIVGPTASGKSKLALFLARQAGGEIINGDSRQVYRHMDIGTDKPSREDREAIPHHLYDMVDPQEVFNLSEYQSKVYECIAEIWSRNKVPFMVGGSGLYVWAVLEGWKIPRVSPNMDLRKILQERAAIDDDSSLYAELRRLDPAVASKIDPRNTRRVIRALEIIYAHGNTEGFYEKKEPGFSSLIIGIKIERKELYRRIDLRVSDMMNRGLVEEVRWLLDRGYSPESSSMSAVGYKEVTGFLKGEMTLRETEDRIRFETHRLVRKQMAWFREKDERINWITTGEDIEAQALKMVKGWLAA